MVENLFIVSHNEVFLKGFCTNHQTFPTVLLSYQ